MNPEKQKQINGLLEKAAQMLDEAIPLVYEAASIAVLDRQFQYAVMLCQRGESMQSQRAGILVSVLTLEVKTK